MKPSIVVKVICAVVMCVALLLFGSLLLWGYTPDPPGGSGGSSGSGGSGSGGSGSGGSGSGGSGGGTGSGPGGGGDCNLPAGCPCNTPLSESEWSIATNLFPRLVRTNTCKEAEATTAYNCLAWTINDTAHCWWLDAVYQGRYYKIDTDGDGLLSVDELNNFYSTIGISNIAYYGFGNGNVKHVAEKCGGAGSTCGTSSKCGRWIGMSHDLGQMEGGRAYGSIVGGN